jgi:hypothetical protein
MRRRLVATITMVSSPRVLSPGRRCRQNVRPHPVCLIAAVTDLGGRISAHCIGSIRRTTSPDMEPLRSRRRRHHGSGDGIMTVLPLRTVLPTLVHDRWDETGCRPVVAGIPAGANRGAAAAPPRTGRRHYGDRACRHRSCLRNRRLGAGGQRRIMALIGAMGDGVDAHCVRRPLVRYRAVIAARFSCWLEICGQ